MAPASVPSRPSVPPGAARTPKAILEAVGVAVPGPAIPQSDVRAKAEEILASLAPELLEKMSVFDNVGIDARHFVRPMDWYLETHGWQERSDAFVEAGLDLLEAAARDALAQADLPVEAVDGVVLVTTTGISTPSLDARLANRMGLREDAQRVPVWGLGCAGGVAGLRLAAQLARANPDKRYLLLSLETCSLAFNLTDLSVRAFVATCLFGDGAAAALVLGERVEGGRLATLGEGASRTWRDTEDLMGWDVTDEGLRVVFSRRIPDVTRERFAPVVEGLVKASGRPVDRFVFHPGGTKVLDAYEQALGQPAAAFRDSREVLRRFGNMSSPTVLFVLRESLGRRPLAPGETALLAALGPGFTAELALLHG